MKLEGVLTLAASCSGGRMRVATKAPPHRANGRGHDTERLVSMQEERIPLHSRNGLVRPYALIDKADAHLAQHRWSLGGDGHPIRWKSGRIVRMSRELLELRVGDRREAEHINGNPLDNRRSTNLRIAPTHAENLQNRQGANSNTTSGVRGVSWDAQTGKWRAAVCLNGKTHRLGRFATVDEAERVVVAFRREHAPFSSTDQVAS